MTEMNKDFGRLYTLEEIFKGRRFKIPEYQRGYSWEKEQRDDLLKDIESIAKSDHMHFTGTIVASKTDTPDLFEIVDGQQRLTSIMILLNEMFRHHALPDQTLSDKYIELFNWRKKDSNLQRVFEMNAETDKIFKTCVLLGEEENKEDLENKSHQNILDAQTEFRKWIKSDSYSSSYFEATITKLGFLFFSPIKSKSIGIMFEVINNRGKPLSELEKIKNYLIYYSIKKDMPLLRERIKDAWRQILKNLSKAGLFTNEDENSFLRNCWILFHTTDKSKSYHVYDYLKELFPGEGEGRDGNQLYDLIRLLVDASAAIRKFHTDNDPKLEQLRYHPVNASIMPLYIAISTTYKKQEVILQNLLDLLEKVNFRVYVMPGVTKRSDSGQGDLFSYAHQLFHNNYPYDNRIYADQIGEIKTDEELKEALINFTLYRCDLDNFVESLTLDRGEKYDYYKWNALRYFLASYDIDLTASSKTFTLDDLLQRDPSKKKADDILHREHIWAWKNRAELFKHDEDKHEKRRLGNFALLEGGINSMGDKKDVWEKIKIYRGENKNRRSSRRQMILNLDDIVMQAQKLIKSKYSKKSKNWYIDFHKIINDEREVKMIKFAIKRWGLVNENEFDVIVDSFVDSKQVRIFEIPGYEKPTWTKE